MNDVVGIYETDEAARRDIQASIARIRQTTVCLVDDAHTSILPRIRVTQGRAAIWRAVIDENHLDVPVCLSQYGIHTGRQILLDAIHWDNERNEFANFISFFLEYLPTAPVDRYIEMSAERASCLTL